MTVKTYRIGDASKMLKLNSSVLRFWESEFSQLVPLRTEKGQRLYTEEDITLLKRIKDLLHEQGMTIDGARRVLMAPEGSEPLQFTAGAAESSDSGSCESCVQKEKVLESVRRELLAMRAVLQQPFQ